MTPTRFQVHPSPVGELLLVQSVVGLIGLEVLHDPLGPALERWSRRLGAVPEPDDAAAAPTAAQLDEYFDGGRTAFDAPIDWSPLTGFTRAALQAVTTIPYAETASYGEVAALAGSPGAHRAAGTACGLTTISIVVPVHRVVRADGSIGEYGGHPEVKRFLLELETGRSAGE
ncbi:MAG: methylated-DNA--[protein]-cysteine S-methyltransferase [Microbacterium sp.]|uniref:methylated-DNA--[protein]-cysteine S-methyltransferase n=1 Tax=Microbacterium sp. TaxID=51671 RepID=UPI0039E406C0